GVPVVPGVHRAGMNDGDLLAAADEMGFPLMVKATAGGGGKGMRVVQSAETLPEALASARREAAAAFGNDDLLIERFVTAPRHIEIQVFADNHGNVIHLGERECSLQRRHQKVVEESPSPLLDEPTRQRMGAAAVEAARAVGYVGAGTVEFIVSGDKPDEFFFMEMNTRLQVEHAVTEEVYGVDLVEWQLQVAAGEPLPLGQDELRSHGHAIEARIYAEDPARGFLPTGGRVIADWLAHGVGIRHDNGIVEGMTVASAYDPMLGKVIAHGPTRQDALHRLRRALDLVFVAGVETNVRFLRALLDDEDVRAGRLDTGLIDRRVEQLTSWPVPDEVLALAGVAKLWELTPGPPPRIVSPFDLATAWRVGEPSWATWRMRVGERSELVHARGWDDGAEVRVGEGPVWPATIEWDGHHEAHITVNGVTRPVSIDTDQRAAWIATPEFGGWRIVEEDELSAARHPDEAVGGTLTSPMPGTVTVVNVSAGDAVVAGQTLLVVEAMKMEHAIGAPVDGVVKSVHVQAGDAVPMDAPLAVVAVREADG
ncbi:MAG: ATP-grasp domain-containing protein, partial [Nitriliruptorales bacterium]|nr:ATP-grasp domain-containing protein [Nitriliruptorales bacterium]